MEVAADSDAGVAEREAKRARQAAELMPRSVAVDRALGWLSAVYLGLCCVVLAPALSVLIPLMLLRLRKRELANASTGEGGSLTAIKALCARAVAAACGFGPDALAVPMIQRCSLTGPGVGGWLFTQFYWRSIVLGFRLTRRVYVDQLVAPFLQRMPFGEVTYMHARTCWLDDVVTGFAGALEGELGQLVILGAGYDTRGRRLTLPESVRCFEVDAPGTQAAKRALLEALGQGEGDVTYVSCDFATQRWIDVLHREGFDFGVPTLFVWEGVTMYLTPALVAETLRVVRQCAPGSRIAFDYLLHRWAFDPALQAKAKATRAREPWQFGLREGEQEPFVQQQGLAVLEHLRRDELLRRYLPRRADGESMGVLADFGGFVLAGRPG